MSREVFDIKEFNYGIISSVDAEDIPSESASDSLNVDGDAGEGKLQGIPDDTEYQTSGSTALTNVKLGEFIENNSVYYAVYQDMANDKISVIKNFQTSTVANRIKEDLITSNVSDNVTMVPDKKSIHIGTGIGSTNVPKWVGYISHKQFGITDYTDTFEGSGLNDATGSVSSYTGSKLIVFDVEITGTGANDTFKWRKDGGSYTTGVSISDITPLALSDGVTIQFAAVTGHTIGDKWHITTEGLYVTNAECGAAQNGAGDRYFGTTATEHTGTGFFTASTLRRWKISLIYDGVQESLLAGSFTDTTGVSDADYYEFIITAANAATNPSNFNRRITGINLYRVDSSNGEEANLGLFRQVASLDINDPNWATISESRKISVFDYGTYYSFSAGGDTFASNPVTYNENTGYSETLTTVILNYALSAAGNGYHFVGECYKSDIPDAERYIFRSKNFRYDIFDWTTDFLVMPEAITALHFYDGKLWGFSLNKTYRINPEGLYIEDIFEDAGCQGQRAVCSNEYGMFFGNFQSAWMYQNGMFSKISDAIRQSTTLGKSWETFTNHEKNANASTLTDLIVTSDSLKGYVLFINERYSSSNKLFAWAYHPARKRWDAFSFNDYASSADAGAFKGKDGEIYLSYGTATQKLMRNTSYQAWEWYSQELPDIKVRQKKSFAMIKADTTGTVIINYGVDGNAPATSYTNGSLINVYNKSIRIKLNAAAGSNSVDSLELVYRLLGGER